MAFNWPGLAKEAAKICIELGIENVNITEKGKTEFRQIVTKSCHQFNERRLRETMSGSEKCVRILKDDYGRKSYFGGKKPGEVRDFYSTRVNMLSLAGNFSHDKRFMRTNFLCRCGLREEQEHIRTSCPIYEDIRAKHSHLDDDGVLVEFFRAVLERRDQLDDEQRSSGVTSDEEE